MHHRPTGCCIVRRAYRCNMVNEPWFDYHGSTIVQPYGSLTMVQSEASTAGDAIFQQGVSTPMPHLPEIWRYYSYISPSIDVSKFQPCRRFNITELLSRWNGEVTGSITTTDGYIFRVHPMYEVHNLAYCDRWSRSVVYQSVTRLSCAKTTERIEVLFGVQSFANPKHVGSATVGEMLRNFPAVKLRFSDSMWPSPDYFGHLLYTNRS